MRAAGPLVLAVAVTLLATPAARAQTVHITPMVGAYIQANSFNHLRSSADSVVNVSRSGAFALGANVEVGFLRGSIAYASGANVSQHGVQGDVGTSKVLAGAVDLVLRPLPRLIVVQPYVLGGIGFKNQDYSWSSGRFNAFPMSERSTAYHVGIGADLMVGSKIGLAAEVSDYISKKPGGGLGEHDAFATVGLRFGL